jgi:hypothetical protein
MRVVQRASRERLLNQQHTTAAATFLHFELDSLKGLLDGRLYSMNQTKLAMVRFASGQGDMVWIIPPALRRTSMKSLVEARSCWHQLQLTTCFFMSLTSVSERVAQNALFWGVHGHLPHVGLIALRGKTVRSGRNHRESRDRFYNTFRALEHGAKLAQPDLGPNLCE